jgi:RecQ family ATP-dependent DNA helicase
MIRATVNPSTASIHATLKNVFGFDTFREGQETIITKILEGKSALAVFPTGSGKSLCYQLSALHLEGLTLVISPLIALMKDQIDFLNKRKIPAARLDSTLEPEEIRRIDSDLRARRLKLLYVAPERFSNERFIQKLRQLKISLMVIDEAHCISEWGHNFRPDYLKLSRLALSLKVERVLTLTATATPAVAKDICREFSIDSDAFIHTGFYRPNLTLGITPCRPNEQIALLLSRLRDRPRGPTIVYVTLQRTAETVANELSKSGFPAQAYHAGLANEKRTVVQDWFMNSSNPIVVATTAFGMGIDKSDIRYVYHYNLPKSLENYSQEIGRAGRDGQASICEMLACGRDITVLENFTFGDTPDATGIGAIADRVLANASEFIDNDISRGMDGILFAANDPTAISPVLRKALKAGVRVIGYDAESQPDAREWFIQQATPEGIAKALIDSLVAEVGKEADIAIVTSSLTAPNQNAWIAEMKKYISAQGLKLNIVTILPSEEDQQQAFKVTGQILKAYPNVKGVIGLSSVAFPGAADAITQANLIGKIAVTGLSTPNQMKPFVKSGCVKSVILWNPVDLGYAAIYAMRAVVDGKLKPGDTELEAGRLGKLKLINRSQFLLGPPFIFSKDNIDKFDF